MASTTMYGGFPAPAELRLIFLEWLDTAGRGAPVSLAPVAFAGGQLHPRALLVELEACEDVMPPTYSNQLGLPNGSTYGAAVEAVRAATEGGSHVG
jgi:hypothetical protein